MPPKRAPREAPPAPMTWRGAIPALAIAVVIDALGLACELLWFFAPALGTVLCSFMVTSSNSVTTAIGNASCGLLGAAAGTVAYPLLLTVGITLSMAVGLFGWLTIGLFLVITNKRIFKANALWFGASLLLEEIPFLNALPMVTGVLIKMYATQIRTEKEAFAQYEKEEAQREIEERKRYEAQLLTERMQLEAANEEDYMESVEAANDTKHEDEEQAA
jgi:hypothetical protein